MISIERLQRWRAAGVCVIVLSFLCFTLSGSRKSTICFTVCSSGSQQAKYSWSIHSRKNIRYVFYYLETRMKHEFWVSEKISKTHFTFCRCLDCTTRSDWSTRRRWHAYDGCPVSWWHYIFLVFKSILLIAPNYLVISINGETRMWRGNNVTITNPRCRSSVSLPCLSLIWLSVCLPRGRRLCGSRTRLSAGQAGIQLIRSIFKCKCI